MKRRRRDNITRAQLKRMRTQPRTQRFKRRSTTNLRTGGLLGVESKFKDISVTGDVFTNDTWVGAELDDGTALCLNGIDQGDGAEQRDGRQYAITSVHINGFVQLDAAESTAFTVPDSTYRIALVLDTQTNANQLSAEDVFDENGASGINAFRNIANTKRFKVLEDMKFRVATSDSMVNEGAANLFARGTVKTPFSMHKVFKKPIIVNCSGTGATVTSIVDNSLHLIGCCNSDSNVSASQKITYTSRVRFVG